MEDYQIEGGGQELSPLFWGSAQVNYYNRHIGDYLKDTSHLTLLEHGIYTRLMDVYYVREAALPQDQIARLIRAKTPDEMAALDSVLSEFFELVSGSWIQHRCEQEIEIFADKSQKAKRSASVRWENRPAHTEGNANAMRTHTEGNAPNNQTPITNNQNKNTSAIAPPEGVCESVWQDFLKTRKAKKAPVTETAMDGIRREAQKAGLPLEQALKTCCERGWTGFKAEWMADTRKTFAVDPAITVPSRQGVDPALAKAIKDSLSASKPSAEIRQRMAQITGASS